ncbi:unnamed protein product [Triticum turgidum subsp. durum]|uniref:Uncharacterized protein n=1 Tax=Triticum turgidum subsp. durum TaxID=4567 RepID=A0A9R1R166_TRITD|nr:unnamed protein product [Triticum turgidum subsp. durum]
MKTKQASKAKAAPSPGKEEEAVAPGGFRKGPWTEQEDMKLAWFVRLFGERRWDFLAKVSGLNRTGKSCRLRWVNYLHPDLKRGRMSPEEERLVVDLHARWGNRWSRIAKAMPGRTDNEIKNYWRTHTRKLHKDTRAASAASASTTTTTSTSMSAASPATTSSSSSSSTNDNDNHSHHGHGDQETAASQEQADHQLLYTSGIGMDSHLLWNDALMDSYAWGAAAPSMIVPPPSSPVWDYCCSDSLWGIGDDEVEYKKMLAVMPTS